MRPIELLNHNDDFRSYFFKNGYCAVRNIFQNTELDNFKSDLLNLALSTRNDAPHRSEADSIKVDANTNTQLDSILLDYEANDQKRLYKFQIAASQLASLYSLIHRADHYARQLYAIRSGVSSYLKGIGLVLGLPQTQRLSYGWHQDSSYHSNMNADNLIHVWFPIFRPVSIGNGTMSFLEGSHKMGQIEFSRVKLEDGGYTTCAPVGAEQLVTKFNEVSVDIVPGDCVFFHSHLVHKSNPNTSAFARMAAVLKLTSEPITTVEPVIVGV